MSVTVAELRRWLDTLPDAAEVAIDEGGLTLREVAEDPNTGACAYLEVGGMPGDEEDEDEHDDEEDLPRCPECGEWGAECICAEEDALRCPACKEVGPSCTCDERAQEEVSHQ